MSDCRAKMMDRELAEEIKRREATCFTFSAVVFQPLTLSFEV